MMEGRRKEVLLLVVAACALAVALITFLGRSGPPPPPPPPASERAAAGPNEQEQADAEEAEGAEGESNRNPFSPGDVEATSDLPPSDPGPGSDLPPTPPDPMGGSLKLTGIVVGKPSVAIIHEDGERYFVRVGEQIGDAYRVQQIGRQQVVLVGQEGTVTLRMGGRQ
jgi:hypothetical protein